MIVAPTSQLRSIGTEKALTATQTFPRFKSNDGDAFKECSSTDIALDPVKPSAIPDAFKNRLIKIKRNNDSRYLTLEDNDGQKTVTLKAPFTGESQIWKVKQLDASGNIFGIVSHADENCILRMNDVTNGCFISSNTGSDFAGTGVSITHDQEIGGYTIMLSTNHRYLDIFTDVDGAVVNSDLMWTKMDSVGWGIKMMPQLGELVTVTNMPTLDYEDYQNHTEFLHPDSGMFNGTWEDNGGAVIKDIIYQLYKKVYGNFPTSPNQYLHSLYGGRYTVSEYKGQFHPGIDILKHKGATIFSAHSGELVKKGSWYIVIKLKPDLYVKYVHLNTTNCTIAQNSEINIGDVLGVESNLETEPYHLHIEVSNDDKTPRKPTPTISEKMLGTIVPYKYL